MCFQHSLNQCQSKTRYFEASKCFCNLNTVTGLTATLTGHVLDAKVLFVLLLAGKNLLFEILQSEINQLSRCHENCVLRFFGFTKSLLTLSLGLKQNRNSGILLLSARGMCNI